MLTRLFIDNYRCLVNFDLQLGSLGLLVGPNGSGKTAIFSAVSAIRRFICMEGHLVDAFPPISMTRWDNRRIQTFEMDLRHGEGSYEYKLVVEHDIKRNTPLVASETLLLNKKPLFSSDHGRVQLYNDEHKIGPKLTLDWGLSGVGALNESPNNKRLQQFRDYVRRIQVVKLIPDRMKFSSDKEDELLESDGSNFVSWLRFALQEQTESMFELNAKLKDVFDDFISFGLRKSGGDARDLHVDFHVNESKDTGFSVRFDELSDGQRALMVLYALLFASRDSNYSLFIDEPENYLALTEIQPWLMELKDSCGFAFPQAVLISHHPELIDYLGPDCGILIKRTGFGPARVEKLPVPPEGTVRLSEWIARGWM